MLGREVGLTGGDLLQHPARGCIQRFLSGEMSGDPAGSGRVRARTKAFSLSFSLKLRSFDSLETQFEMDSPGGEPLGISPSQLNPDDQGSEYLLYAKFFRSSITLKFSWDGRKFTASEKFTLVGHSRNSPSQA